MFEKRFIAVPPQPLTANGGADGSISIADTSLFKVQQKVIITATGQSNLALEVKKILSSTLMFVGPIVGNFTTSTNLSAYTTANSASISANEQTRPVIANEVADRAIYECEPVVARRMVLVDKFGNKFDADNPLPTSAVVNLGDITIGAVDQGDPNNNNKAWPVKVIGTGNNVLKVNNDGSTNVNIKNATDEPGLDIQHNEISSVGSGTETPIITITVSPSGLRVQKVIFSGDNIALYRIKVDGVILATYRTWWMNFNGSVGFEGFANGLVLTHNQVLTVTVIHDRIDLGAFEATVMSV